MNQSSNTDHSKALENARQLFAQKCEFLLSVAGSTQLPNLVRDEVAFAGRSNVGKSSLLNALVGHKALARSSNTPGRTRQINFFDLAGRLMLVDLPGYGYARAPRSDIVSWTGLVQEYFRLRASLRRVCLLIDSRHGLKETDLAVMSILDETGVSYLIVLTKIDKIDKVELAMQMEKVKAGIAKRPAAHPLTIATSVRVGTGIDDLRLALAPLAKPNV